MRQSARHEWPEEVLGTWIRRLNVQALRTAYTPATSDRSRTGGRPPSTHDHDTVSPVYDTSDGAMEGLTSKGGTPDTLRNKNHVMSGLAPASSQEARGKEGVHNDVTDKSHIPVQRPTSPT